MIIAQISDTHIALDTPDAEQRIRDFERTIADINSLDPVPDVIVHTGDIVHNGRPDEYDRAEAILAKAVAPVYVMTGNKDDRTNLRTAFPGRETSASDSAFIGYSVEDFPIRLIMLDTVHASSNKGDFCPERAQNLVDLIDAEPIKPIAVFAHHPPFDVPVGPTRLNFATQEAMQLLRQALQHSGRVAAIFSGHVHRSTWGSVGNIRASVMPSVATSVRWGDYPVAMATRPVYYIHRFDPAGGFSTETRIVGL